MRKPLGASFIAALTAASLLVSTTPAAAQDPPPPTDPPLEPAPPPSEAPPDKPPPSNAPPPSTAPPSTLPAAPEPAPPAELPALPGSQPEGSRTMKGVVFQTPLLVDSAFVSSFAGVAVALGKQVEPGVTVFPSGGSGQMFSYDRALGLADLRIQAGVAIAGRVELGLDARYATYSVSDPTSALVFGGRTAYDVRPGLRLRAFRSASTGTQIGLHAYGTFASDARLNPAGVLAEIASISADSRQVACLAVGDLSCAFPESLKFDPQKAMNVSRQVFGGGAAVTAAQAFGSRFGVQASLGLEVARAVVHNPLGDLSSTPVTVAVGLAPSVDFGPVVPLTLMAEYRFGFTTETPAAMENIDTVAVTTLAHGVAAGLYYTGRRDLSVGMNFNANLSSSSTSAGNAGFAPVTQLLGQASMRYFF
jgi:hypothetical protein